jgi:CTP:phosphocholine cytidylyltransferase-like protein
MCPILNGFRDRAISLYSFKMVDKYILRIVYNTGIYCSSDKVGTLYLVQHIFENSAVNISALCNLC